MGKAHASGLGEVDFSAAIYSYYADDAERFLSDEHITLLDGEGSAVIRRRPLGMLLGIMPRRPASAGCLAHGLRASRFKGR